jgi:perosamine synthetase
MNLSLLEKAITPKTRAIMAVHIYGHPVDMNPILEVARGRKLKVIEDAAEAHGATYRGKPCGCLGDVGCLSFYANKVISTGEGGMVLTGDAKLAERARSLRNLCFRPERRFLHTELGWNFRMTNLQAAVGVAQLARFSELVAWKRAMGGRYAELLRGAPGLILPVEKSWATNVYWVYGLVLDDSVPFGAAELAKRLEKRGIQTRPFFMPLHLQPVLRERGLGLGADCPVSERIGERGLYLPSGLGTTDEEMRISAAAVREILEEAA